LKAAKNQMGKNSLVIPSFDSEEKEEAWLWQHRHELEAEMGRRIKEGTAFRKRPDPSKTVRKRKQSA
jgi:hypothetical protein